MRMLLIEDDAMVGRALRTGLSQDGHAVDWVQNASSAHTAWIAPSLEQMPYDAVIVDMGLPDGHGIDLIRKARARGIKSVVLVVTARGQIADRIAGLDAGADDYMVKPIDLEELSARLRAVERRLAGRDANTRDLGALSIDPQTRTVCLGGQPVDLTAQEYAVLWALARRPNSIVSRTRIEEELYSWDKAAESNTVEVQIHRLRRKLGAGTIVTQRGLGYRLVEPKVP